MRSGMAVALAALFVASAHADWVVKQPNLGTIVLGIDMTSETSGFMAGSTNGLGNIILKTDDGGDSVYNVLNDPLVTFLNIGIAANSNTSAVAAGIGMFAIFNSVCYTEDGTNFEGSPSEANNLIGVWQDTYKDLEGNCFYLTGDWVALSGEGKGVAVSCDGGKRFRKFDWGIDMPARYSSFVNSTHGFVSGGRFPTEEEDATVLGEDGARLHYVTDRYAVRVKDDMKLPQREAVRNYEGAIARTTDGGQTFEEVFRTNEYYFNQIRMINDRVGFAVGENNRDGRGVILKTTDAGDSWREVFTTSRSLVALAMVSETEGWVGGATFGIGVKSYFVRTTDGGDTWSEYDSDAQYGIFSISGTSPSSVFAVGPNQAVSGLLKFQPDL